MLPKNEGRCIGGGCTHSGAVFRHSGSPGSAGRGGRTCKLQPNARIEHFERLILEQADLIALYAHNDPSFAQRSPIQNRRSVITKRNKSRFLNVSLAREDDGGIGRVEAKGPTR